MAELDTNLYAIKEQSLNEVSQRELTIANALAEANCPFFRTPVDVLSTQDKLYLVSEYYPFSLRTYTPKSLEELRLYLRQLLIGLACAQEELEFVHNDLEQLSNIVVKPGDYVAMTDFGESRLILTDGTIIGPSKRQEFSAAQDVVGLSIAFQFELQDKMKRLDIDYPKKLLNLLEAMEERKLTPEEALKHPFFRD